jgi:hypothetical protein
VRGRSAKIAPMCRSIVTLRRTPAATPEDVHAAALQFVRKVSGYRVPSRANEAAFATAVDEIAASVERLLESLPAGRPAHEVLRPSTRRLPTAATSTNRPEASAGR